MARVELKAIEKHWPDASRALRPLDLVVEDGELTVLVGPSGCGKTTLLRILAGLEAPSAGRVLFDDRDVTAMTPQQRNVAMVFQSYALYPHMTVRANLDFPLRMARVPRAERRARIERTADLLGLTDLLRRKPAQLSGGQRQRVAMGRALVRHPAVFLLDEPLSNLDAKLRVEIRAEIASLVKRLGTTTIYVTHDQVEAMTLGDRIAVLEGGVLQQAGDSQALYDQPANTFVASFLGSPGMNLLPLEAVEGDAVRVAGQRVVLAGAPPSAKLLGFRPEALHPAGAPGPTLEGEVVSVEALGHEQLVHLASTEGEAPPPRFVARLATTVQAVPGHTMRLRLDPAAARFFDAEGRAVAP